MVSSVKVWLSAFCCVAIVGIASNQAHAYLPIPCATGGYAGCEGKNRQDLCILAGQAGTCRIPSPYDTTGKCYCALPGPAVSNGGFVVLALSLVGMAVWAGYRRNRISAT
jgi:hypothetical protein